MSVKTDTQYFAVKELQNVHEYVDNLSYEEWKQVTFSVLHFGSITQRNLMRCIYLDNVNGRKIDEDLISYAFELSQSLHGLPEMMLEISSAESLVELKEVFDVHEGFIDSSKRFLAETIQVLIMLDYQFGYGNGVVAFRIDSLLGWGDFVTRKGETINAD